MVQPAPLGTGCIEVSCKSYPTSSSTTSLRLSSYRLLSSLRPFQVTSFLARLSRSAAWTPPPNARERHGYRGRAGAGEAGYRKQSGERKMRGATACRDRPSGSVRPRVDDHRCGRRSSLTVALLQVLALINATIRARLRAH